MGYALITGGSRGIGRAIALKLAKKGHHILINYKSNEEAAIEAKQIIESEGGKASLMQFDVSNKEQTREVLDAWQKESDDHFLEILVNNAGVRRDNILAFMTDDEWDDVLNIHLGGFYTVTKAVMNKMIRKKYGRIVNIVSLSGIKGMAGQTNYAAAKAGIIAATKSLAQEISRKNITVNCVAPGFIRTEMIDDIDEDKWKGYIPMRRFGKAEEVAAVVDFLSSKDASYITGEVISVNGGLYT